MFGKHIQKIEFTEIVAFLQTGVREGMALDFKLAFPAHLEKTLSAFANTHGGIVLIGVGETETGAAVLPIAGVEMKPGLRERVLQKALEAIYPPLLPDVHVVAFKSDPSLTESDRALVVVGVSESAETPHSVEDRTVVYLRGDNVSTRVERKARVGEIEWLLNKRQKSVELKKRLISQAADRAESIRPIRRGRNQQKKYWKDGDVTLTLTATFPRLPLMPNREWLEAVDGSRVELNSAPLMLPGGRMQRVSGGLFFDDLYVYSEYQAQGLILHQLDYWWDYVDLNTSVAQRQLYPSAMAALFASVLENAAKVFRSADYGGTLDFSFKASGLAGAYFISPRREMAEIPHLTESEVRIDRMITVAQLEETSIEVARGCQRELYWAFGYDAPEGWLAEDFGVF